MEMTGKQVAIAILNGESSDNFEYRTADNTVWFPVGCSWSIGDFTVEGEVFRRKVRTRVINGFTVPAPLNVKPNKNEYCFVPDISSNDFYGDSFWIDCAIDNIWFDRGLIFSTKEAAIANAKAMCGIDPNT